MQHRYQCLLKNSTILPYMNRMRHGSIPNTPIFYSRIYVLLLQFRPIPIDIGGKTGTAPFLDVPLCLSFSSFCSAYFSLCRSLQRTHFVARPLSPKAAQGRKFLQPLHHLIWRPVCVTIHTLTSQRVHRPLFWVGMMANPFPVAFGMFLLLPNGRRDVGILSPFFCFPPWEQGHAWPHMTQQRIPSGTFGGCFWFMWPGKFTKLLNSGICASLYFSMFPWNLAGTGGLWGSHLRLDAEIPILSIWLCWFSCQFLPRGTLVNGEKWWYDGGGRWWDGGIWWMGGHLPRRLRIRSSGLYWLRCGGGYMP